MSSRSVALRCRADLDLRLYEQVAWHGVGVCLHERAIAAIERSRRSFMALIDSDQDLVIYGVTSGYGQRAHERFNRCERALHAARAPYAAAAGFGEPLPERVTRGIVLARLANFIEGHAAVSLALARAVAGMLDGGPLPQVPAQAVTSAGEIIGLAHLFVPLADRLALQEKEALSLVNGAPVAAAMACDAVLSSRARLARATDVLALSAEAMLAPLEAYDPALDALWEDEHEAAALAHLRQRLAGGARARRAYQAPVSYRILPRILGQGGAALARAERDAALSLRAVSDNPVYIAPDLERPDPRFPHGRALSNGGFHDARAVLAMDGLTRTWADLALLCDRHISALVNGNVSRLPPDLVSDGGGYVGCTGFVAADLAEQARACAQPTLIPGSEGGGFGQNDVASPAPAAWRKLERAGSCLDGALAALAVVASQALFVTQRAAPPTLRPLLEQVRAWVAPVREPRMLGPELGRLAAAFDPRPGPGADREGRR